MGRRFVPLSTRAGLVGTVYDLYCWVWLRPAGLGWFVDFQLVLAWACGGAQVVVMMNRQEW